MLSDRRKFKRFDVSLDVAFRASKGTGESYAGVTKNFSRSGVCFELDDFPPVKDSLAEVEVKLPHQDSFVTVMGSVAWKEQVKDKCWVGLEFVEMDKEAKSQILDYAYDIWVEENMNQKSLGSL
jgi:c-di-GMP-binding flagellar brake protein YcgR